MSRIEIIIDLVKWFLGSFVILILPIMIGKSLDDRKQGLQEIEKYDKYATELIIQNDNLGKRRLLAQYFAYVTPSEILRSRWLDYYQLLDAQWKAIVKRQKEIEEEKEKLMKELAMDSLIMPAPKIEIRPESSKRNPASENTITENPMEEKLERLKELEKASEACKKELNSDLKMPEDENAYNNN